MIMTCSGEGAESTSAASPAAAAVPPTAVPAAAVSPAESTTAARAGVAAHLRHGSGVALDDGRAARFGDRVVGLRLGGLPRLLPLLRSRRHRSRRRHRSLA